ncbi:unnamed protein product [Mytilus coruscus]|uniref:Mutator-like transposase domain-containing protein n=1 Tax=Mytilus coruscus TaxID=42192 RepID=A0A6J8BFC6_MYTCO|nr:unnamed protein product [Mytilus coruscus]
MNINLRKKNRISNKCDKEKDAAKNARLAKTMSLSSSQMVMSLPARQMVMSLSAWQMVMYISVILLVMFLSVSQSLMFLSACQRVMSLSVGDIPVSQSDYDVCVRQSDKVPVSESGGDGFVSQSDSSDEIPYDHEAVMRFFSRKQTSTSKTPELSQKLSQQPEATPIVKDDIVPPEIKLMSDKKFVPMYLKLLESGSEKKRDIRLVIVGKKGAGKTSLLKRLFGEKMGGVRSTNGIEIHRVKCHAETNDGIWNKLEDIFNYRMNFPFSLYSKKTRYCPTLQGYIKIYKHLQEMWNNAFREYQHKSPACEGKLTCDLEKEKKRGFSSRQTLICARCSYISEKYSLYEELETGKPGRKPSKLDTGVHVGLSQP